MEDGRWPFPVEGGGEAPMMKVRVLGQNEAEAAYLATVDHFKGHKPAVPFTDPAFTMRERAEMVFRAYSVDGDPLAEDVTSSRSSRSPSSTSCTRRGCSFRPTSARRRTRPRTWTRSSSF
jgi:hypothetical protein